jgi:hypothetical protein
MPPKEISRPGRRLDEGGGRSRHKLPNVCVLRETVTRRRDLREPGGAAEPRRVFFVLGAGAACRLATLRKLFGTSRE